MKNKMEIPSKAFTHAGKFHADDVFSAALLKMIRPTITIQRGFSVPSEFDGIVFDIGGGKYDHHQLDKAVRSNGVPYAAFGLLWKEFGPQLVGEHQAEMIDRNFIQPLDKHDNTGVHDSLADAINDFIPAWDSEEAMDAAFDEAVKFADGVLRRRIETANAITRAEELVGMAYSKMQDGIVILPKYAPWQDALRDSEALFVVFPSLRMGYSAQGVNVPGTRDLKVPFPAEWAGRRDADLQQISKIPGLNFCHASRFMVSGNTMEDVIAACLKTLSMRR